MELFNEELSPEQMVKMRKKFDFTGQIFTASRALTDIRRGSQSEFQQQFSYLYRKFSF